MSFEAWGTPPDQEPKYCPVCDQESHSADCELGKMQSRAFRAEYEIAELKRQLEGERAAALNYRNDAIEAGKKCDGLVAELEAARKDAEKFKLLVGEMRDGMVVWFDVNPHGAPEGTQYYVSIEQASSCNESHEKGGV